MYGNMCGIDIYVNGGIHKMLPLRLGGKNITIMSVTQINEDTSVYVCVCVSVFFFGATNYHKSLHSDRDQL